MRENEGNYPFENICVYPVTRIIPTGFAVPGNPWKQRAFGHFVQCVWTWPVKLRANINDYKKEKQQ